MKTSIIGMYESYVDNLGFSAMRELSSGSSWKNLTLKTPSMELIVNNAKPVNVISSLSLSPNHEISMSFNSTGARRRLSGQLSIPLVLSVTKSTLYDSTNSHTNISESVPVYKFASNPLRLQLDCTLAGGTKIKAVLQNTVMQSYDPIKPLTRNYKTVCEATKKVSYSYTCHYVDDSMYNISVNCDGSKNVTYITECPDRLRTPSCSVMSSTGSCTEVGHDKSSITCMCDICSSSERRLSKVESLTYQLTGMVKYTYNDYTSKATSPMTMDIVENVVLIYTTFAVFWVLIIASVPIKSAVYNSRKLKIEPKSTSVVPEHVAETLTKERRMSEYIGKYLPKIYKEEESYLSKLLDVLLRNHMYINMMFMKSIYKTKFLQFMEAFKVLTILTTSMFILVVLYSVQYPSNDGTCKTLTKESCLGRTSFGREYCVWSDDGQCKFNEPEFSITTVIFLAWLELLLVAPISTVTTITFDYILLAPTRTTVQEQLKERKSAKLIRRVSQVGQNIGKVSVAVRRRFSVSVSSKVSDVEAEIKRQSMAVKKTLLVDQQFVESRRLGNINNSVVIIIILFITITNHYNYNY
jgi:hypothetical protein